MASLNLHLFAIVLSLFATFQLPGGNCQDLRTLSLKLQEQHALQSSLNDHPHLVEEEELRNALDALRDLWTVYLPELWQNKSELSQPCMNSVDDLIPGLRVNSSRLVSPKLLPLLDAAGKQGAGLLTGNIIMDGAYDECFSYDYTSYCVAYQVNITKLPFSWRVGLCVPKYCTNTDLALLINSVPPLKVSEYLIKCTDEKTPSYGAGAIVMLVVTSIFIAMVVVGSAIDVILQYIIPLILSGMDTTSVAVNSSLSHDPGTSEKIPLLERSNIQNKPKGLKPWDFITAFSLFKTVPTLLSTKQAPSVITSLNGLRVISMFWVILGHGYSFAATFGNIDNPIILMSVLSRFSFQAVENAFFSVDSFFFLSGVLVAYLTLREMKKKKGRFPFLHYYIHRYLRLTPTYAFVLFFAWFLTTHLAYGPYLSPSDPLNEACSKYWWTNLLYINNLYPWKLSDECIGWSWYLANDMQFYVISPLILISAYHLLPVGIIIAALFVGSGFLITGVLTGVYDFQASMFSIFAYGYANRPNATQNYGDAIYIKPWDRIAPYVVGLALGYILYRGFRFRFSRFVNTILYMSVGYCCLGRILDRLWPLLYLAWSCSYYS